MANRAYLYSADLLDAWDFPDERYYDSRHVIPLSWFFFYRASDVTMVDATFDGSNWWKEVKLAANKDSACELFVARRPLLLDLIAGRLDSRIIDEFLETVRGRKGQYLLMDPGEVVDDSDEELGLEFARFLEKIEEGDRNAQAVLVEARNWIGDFSDDRERCLVDVVGCTYGPD
jgi:hypothetical protein